MVKLIRIGYDIIQFIEEKIMKKLLSALLILSMLVSMVCVSSSAAGMHINMNFESMDVFTNQFIAGAFYTGDNLLYGYAEAKALQSIYETDEDLGIFKNTAYTWLTYDATITLSMADDDLSETERFVNLVYCNDNPKNLGRVEDRIMMSFGYDVAEGLFYFSEGWNNPGADNPAANYMEPVAMELETDSGENFVTLGISVERGRIRCFCNDQLIFDFVDSADDYAIAKDVNSCFLFWQDGNFVQISNISVADQGYLFPNSAAPVQTTAPVVDDPDVTTTTAATTTSEATTRIESEVVTNKDGETSIVTKVITEATTTPKAETNNKPTGGTSTSTGDATFVVVAALVATLGCAVIVKKVSVR